MFQWEANPGRLSRCLQALQLRYCINGMPIDQNLICNFLNIFWYYKVLTYISRHAMQLQRREAHECQLIADKPEVNAGYPNQQCFNVQISPMKTNKSALSVFFLSSGISM